MPGLISLKFDERGLVPAIVQDSESGEVLMLAYMNQKALEATLETGETHFWSRSRQEQWHKGATSGNIQTVVSIAVDCDADALLVRVHPAGPACHTGNQTCFYRSLTEKEDEDRMDINQLFQVICDRRDNPSEKSYTARLIAQGEDEILKKVGEEAMEVLLAAKGQGDQRVVEEVADLTYHVLVLLASRGLSPEDIRAELSRRHQPKV
jgi:phosphoribosyl-ATP pyrophosphohydrolase/phosphoribosyl-AMP cyclohydrolase